MGKIYEGDIGVVIRLNTGVDLTGAASIGIYYLTPGGSSEFWPATIYNTTYVQYTTTESMEAGDWLLQSYAKFSTSSEHRGETYTLTVYEYYE